MLLEDCPKSRAPVKVIEPHFAVFPEFKLASYRDRYAILIEKLLRDRLYDGACFLLSSESAAATGDYIEPHPELTFAKFVTPLVAQAAIITLVAVPFGFQLYPVHVVVGLLLLGIFGVGVGALSYALAIAANPAGRQSSRS